jgi:hypothetical protein
MNSGIEEQEQNESRCRQRREQVCRQPVKTAEILLVRSGGNGFDIGNDKISMASSVKILTVSRERTDAAAEAAARIQPQAESRRRSGRRAISSENLILQKEPDGRKHFME